MINKSYFLKFAIAIFQLGCYMISVGQSTDNLLPNGGFELKTGIPTTWGQAHLLESWNQFYTGKWSPVTYFSDFENKGYVPTWKQGGKQSPHSGYGFVGLGLSFKYIKNVGAQYIESKLISPLEKDSVYIISAYVSLADRLKYAIDYIPVAFSDKSLLNSTGSLIYSANVLKLKSNQPYLDNTKEWMSVSVKYKAIGGEQFFLIGGIEGNKKLGAELKVKRMPFLLSFQYLLLNKLTFYFIDDVSIQKQFKTIKQSESSTIPNLDLTTNEVEQITLNDVSFELNSYTLSDTVNTQLDGIVLRLKMCSTCKVKIVGYTDNTGMQETNLDLSLMRAKSIYSYLYDKGIPYERMQYAGLGESNPIADNNLPDGRSKNRRVEIKIFK